MTAKKISTNSPQFVTLNCSGGISLGAYMAGVFYELTKEAAKPNSKLVIDIITGASAGAMSATLAAYCLLKGKVEDDYKNSVFYRAWVEQADIQAIDSWKVMFDSFVEGFKVTIESYRDAFQQIKDSFGNQNPTQQPKLESKGNLSVLSGEAIERIAQLIGLKKFEPYTEIKIDSDEVPKINSETKPLVVLMTLTNLQGLLETRKLIDSQSFLSEVQKIEKIKTITSEETRIFAFSSKLPQETMNNMWGKAVVGSLASGAFPIAFPPIPDTSTISSLNLENLSDDYFEPNANRQKLRSKNELGGIYEDEQHLTFLYSDGGILDGLPLIRGIDLANRLDFNLDPLKNPEFQQEFLKDRVEDKPERLHIYIRPIPVENLKSEPRLTRKYFSMFEVAFSGLTLPREEHDPIRLREVRERNQKVELKQQLLNEFKTKLSEQFSKVKEVLEEVIPEKEVKISPITPAIIQNLSDFGEDFKKLYNALPKTIQEKLKVGDAAALLASDFLGAFGGFFEQKYRDRDFLLGRLSGISWLKLHCDGVTIAGIDTLTQKIEAQKSLFDKDPTPSNLKLSQKIRIARILLRAVRILIIEIKVIGTPWILGSILIKFPLILLVAILEVAISLIFAFFAAIE
jgi:Patatin-like phospholipase